MTREPFPGVTEMFFGGPTVTEIESQRPHVSDTGTHIHCVCLLNTTRIYTVCTHTFTLTLAMGCTQMPILNRRFTREPASKQKERPLQNPLGSGRGRTGPAERPSEPGSVRATWKLFPVPIREGRAALCKGFWPCSRHSRLF